MNLGKDILESSCNLVGVAATGSITSMARRLHKYYQKLALSNANVASVASMYHVSAGSSTITRPRTTSVATTSSTTTTTTVSPTPPNMQFQSSSSPGMLQQQCVVVSTATSDDYNNDVDDFDVHFDSSRDFGHSALPGGLINSLFRMQQQQQQPSLLQQTVLASPIHSHVDTQQQIPGQGPSHIDVTDSASAAYVRVAASVNDNSRVPSMASTIGSTVNFMVPPSTLPMFMPVASASGNNLNIAPVQSRNNWLDNNFLNNNHGQPPILGYHGQASQQFNVPQHNWPQNVFATVSTSNLASGPGTNPPHVSNDIRNRYSALPHGRAHSQNYDGHQPSFGSIGNPCGASLNIGGNTLNNNNNMDSSVGGISGQVDWQGLQNLITQSVNEAVTNSLRTLGQRPGPPTHGQAHVHSLGALSAAGAAPPAGSGQQQASHAPQNLWGPLVNNGPQLVPQNDFAVPTSHVIGSSSVPSMPGKYILQIKKGEFVNFHSLYTAITTGMAHGQEYTIALPSDNNWADTDSRQPTVAIRPRHASNRITSFVAWSRTWNDYLRVFVFYRPHLFNQLLHYQSIIAGFANIYPTEAWLAYDADFRQSVANNPSLRWDRIDDEIFNRRLRSVSAIRPSTSRTPTSTGSLICYRCGQEGHMARRCTRSYAQRGSRASFGGHSNHPANLGVSTVSSTSSTQPFQAPQRQRPRICFAYNDGRFCRVGCQWGHRCSQCNGSHPRFACNNPSGSNP